MKIAIKREQRQTGLSFAEREQFAGVRRKRYWLRLFLIESILLFQVSAFSAGNEMSFDYFSQENGLPNNQVQCIFQDQRGWMWIGTSQGLSRFDGYQFVNFLHLPDDSLSLKGTLVRVIFEDRKGNLLIGTENGGLNLFDRHREVFYHPYENHPLFKNQEVSVNDIKEDGAGNLWLGTNNNILKIDTLGNVSEVSGENGRLPGSIRGEFVRVLQFDRQGKLWAGTNNGIFVIDTDKMLVKHFALPFTNHTDEIWEIFPDEDGSLWIGTYSSGILIVDPVSGSVKPLELKPVQERTKTVRSISRGPYGNYWIGTRGGLYVYNKDKGTTLYLHDERELSSLINNSVLDIFHDRQGETWIGTRGGLNLLAKSRQVFRNFRAHPSDRSNKYLNSAIIHAFWMDDKKNIWVGTEDGGVNIYHPETGKYSYLMANASRNSISRNCVKAFLDDQKGNLWIGTFLGGIDVLNRRSGEITHYRNNPNQPGSLSDNKVWDFLLDNDGTIWVGTSAGIDRFDPVTHKFKHYPQLAGQEQVNWIELDSSNNIWLGTTDEVIIYNQESGKINRFREHSRSFLEDSKGRCWITTLDHGIARYSSSKGPEQYFDQEDGLSNNQALCILEDHNHFLWISTSNGLSKFDPENDVFQTYTSKDGLQNNQFTYGAAYKSEDGQLLFGGISGFNMFDPSEVKSDNNQAPLAFTELRVFNRKVMVGQSKKNMLEKSISETSRLILNYRQNVFTLEFAALNFVNSESNLYSYYLEGFDKDWNEPSTSRTATYTNLNPDDYILHVRRVVPGIPENNNELTLQITVLPPFWKTIWFRMLVLIVTGLLIFLLIQFFLYREKIKNELVFERLNARKLHELDMLKLKFFTNISHEIRTPLTLILAPLEKLMSQQLSQEAIRSHLDIMFRNAKNLDRLINQLLDFRKLEAGNLKLEPVQGDIVGFVADVVHSFDAYAGEKEISLKFNTLRKRMIAHFDADKLEKILNNLLSNALKFTEKGGKVTVNLSIVYDTNEEDLSNESPDREYIEIAVRDTGQGISQSNTKKIFNRFFQANEKDVQTGTGIGLAFVKELVKLHKGKIFVESKPGKGSKFTVRIPYEAEAVESVKPVLPGVTEKAEDPVKPVPSAEEPESDLQSKIMLVVEDNADVRTLIRSHFSPQYQVYEAGDGRQGWEMALETIPDVIISDILMPDIDGYEFCKKVKKDERTSHIPVLLLTALHSKEHEIKGLSCGADDYITKPFDLAILQTKIVNMLSIRDSLKEKYSGEVILQPKNIVISSPDEKFLHKIVEVIENNMEDAELDIEKFARKAGVSRMQLYRKLHALTDMTVKEFIRTIRLKRAAQLLVQDTMSVSEIAYAVGFKDLSHFRKCFRQMYSMTATEYKQKHPVEEH